MNHMYFTNTQNDRQIEKLMTLKPNFKPRGYGIIVCMTYEVVCAETFKELIKNALSNILIPAFSQRLNQYLKESEGNLMNFKGTSHENIFRQELAKRKNPTSPILCALYLLTADDRLWAKVKHHVEGNSVAFGSVQLGDISTDAYALFMTAKDLCLGTRYITVNDLADRQIIPQRLFGIICEAMTLRRYGVAALNAVENESAKQQLNCKKDGVYQ